jgi:hypothetical protein
MAKKRTVRKAARRTARAKPARRRASRKQSDAEETMNIIAGILVVILIGLGIYFYQASQRTGAIEPPTQVAMIAAQ